MFQNFVAVQAVLFSGFAGKSVEYPVFFFGGEEPGSFLLARLLQVLGLSGIALESLDLQTFSLFS